MSQHYVQVTADQDPMIYEPLPLDPMHYLKVQCSDPMMADCIRVTEWNSDRVKEVLHQDAFATKYGEVDMSTDPDQHSAGSNAPIVTSQNGTKFAISVDDEGNITAIPVIE